MTEPNDPPVAPHATPPHIHDALTDAVLASNDEPGLVAELQADRILATLRSHGLTIAPPVDTLELPEGAIVVVTIPWHLIPDLSDWCAEIVNATGRFVVVVPEHVTIEASGVCLTPSPPIEDGEQVRRCDLDLGHDTPHETYGPDGRRWAWMNHGPRPIPYVLDRPMDADDPMDTWRREREGTWTDPEEPS